MVLEILYIVVMLLWFLSLFPHPSAAQFAWAGGWLGFIAVLLLGLILFVPALGGR